MNRSSAEILALEALSWIAESGAIPDFLDRSGLEIADLRLRAGNPELLAAVLDFLLSQDSLTKSFCEIRELDAGQIHLARRALPGGSGEE
jgi:hypothetical protein